MTNIIDVLVNHNCSHMVVNSYVQNSFKHKALAALLSAGMLAGAAGCNKTNMTSTDTIPPQTAGELHIAHSTNPAGRGFEKAANWFDTVKRKHTLGYASPADAFVDTYMNALDAYSKHQYLVAQKYIDTCNQIYENNNADDTFMCDIDSWIDPYNRFTDKLAPRVEQVYDRINKVRQNQTKRNINRKMNK